MSGITYRNGELFCEDVPAALLASRYDTPLYVYSRATMLNQLDSLRQAFARLSPTICFSIKSCSNLHILRLLCDAGASFDAVSGGEIRRALEAGADPQSIVFAGVGKTRTELEYAVGQGIGWFNAESAGELDLLAEVVRKQDRKVQVALRLNPDVDAVTHPYTTTGKRENKFGITAEEAHRLVARFAGHDLMRIGGVHVHIGSPVRTARPYAQAVERVLAFIDEAQENGTALDTINLGGGWAIDDGAEPVATMRDYADAIVPLLQNRGLNVHMEPGRIIAADAGVLITRVLYVKEGRDQRFLITDAAMTELIRPSLYQAYHFIWPVAPGEDAVPNDRSQRPRSGTARVDIVGPVCESADFLGKDRCLPPVDRGDLLAVFSAGAYASSMSSQYNTRCRAAEVLVSGDRHQLIRRRETYDDLVRCERQVEPPA